MSFSSALTPYARAFKNGGKPFLHFYAFPEKGEVLTREYSRSAFWELACKAAAVLKGAGLKPGDACLHLFGGNNVMDLAFRLGSVMTGVVPVTVNWQADDAERVAFKIVASESRFLIHDHLVDQFLSEIGSRFPDLPCFDTARLESQTPLDEAHFEEHLSSNDPKIIIFTSGTTGLPKGALHAFRSYETNQKIFDQFLEPGPSWAGVVVNPLHHANATAVTDWCMRDPGAEIHLFERYSTPFWRILMDIAGNGPERIITPLTARHFDFFEHLQKKGTSSDFQEFQTALNRIDFLMGSAPVGPTTVARIQKYTGRTPTVRFGSTETCLQVMGIPINMSEKARLAAFQRGWDHGNGEQSGYYIGRPHPPFTEVRVVKSIRPQEPDFMQDAPAGSPGFLVTRGDNLMTRYVKNPEATASVFSDGWYTGLCDVGFWLPDPQDGQPDFYWMTRESTLLIKGGANYSYDQIGEDLVKTLAAGAQCKQDDFDLAVIGLRVHSEHEDACCVTVSLSSDAVGKRGEDIIKALEGCPIKSSRPDFVRFAPIPRNFKGLVKTQQLKAEFREWLDESGA